MSDLLSVQYVEETPPPPKKPAHFLCPKCWQTVDPIEDGSGGVTIEGGFGHRPDCENRAPTAADLALDLPDLWVYMEPGWNWPVLACGTCGPDLADEVGDDENFSVGLASDYAVEDLWARWIADELKVRSDCWRCGNPLPSVSEGTSQKIAAQETKE
jgi:hypothetical protein